MFRKETMQIKLYLFFSVFFIFALPTFAEKPWVGEAPLKLMAPKKAAASEEKSIVSSSGDLAQSIIDGTPNLLLSVQEKIALKNYLYKLGLNSYGSDNSVGGSNSGINNYFEKMWGKDQNNLVPSNKCFQERALSFYSEVSKKINSEKMSRATIKSKLGDEFSKDLKPGWLWELALKHAGGNEYAAMTLIGLCGHDDTSHSALTVIKEVTYLSDIQTKASLDFLEADIQFLMQDNKEKIAELQSLNPDNLAHAAKFNYLSKTIASNGKAIAAYEKEIASLKSPEGKPIVRKVNDYFECPARNSAFYYPEGLGAGVDISPELKSKISKTQYENAPSKHYHVYGAAFMSCGLMANGFGPKKSVIIQSQSAKAYRGIRMCSDIQSTAGDVKRFDEVVASPAKASGLSEEQYILDQIKNIDCKAYQVTEANLATAKTKWCRFKKSLFYEYEYQYEGKVIPDDIVKKKLSTYTKKMDAYKLYGSWYLGSKEVLGKQMPCTDIQTGGPKDIYNISTTEATKFKPEGWSEDRFKEASKSLASMMVDFEWTAAQHEVGAKFAADKCKSARGGLNPFDRLCSSSGPTLEVPSTTTTEPSVTPAAPKSPVTPAGVAN